ncbi:MAG: glutathione S-transferase family protein [Methyloceanibacter sp.]|uniref:glutathione S-transferase family protein n=1 Tax=Methyloceanibacter sp. TaxID=1965321 RepID=UPI001D7FD75D|nr:glutathione S-transferase family protein [Methyloceanibacter sp.]MCB1443799.1 glutathione S-transferase family protein [Methyloceanibacter sp.]
MVALTLYHAVPSRSSSVRWMLEELGEPYEIELIALSKGDQRSEAYKAINPMGKVPALRHGDAVVSEAAAICTYLADAFPGANLNIPIGDPLRGPYLKWLFFGPSCIEAAILDRAMPRKEEPRRGVLGYGDIGTVLDVVSGALKGGPYLMGQQFTAADVVVGSALRFGATFKLLPDLPEIAAYIARLQERPALQRTVTLDGELAAAAS